jgi:hypothetical protein
MLKRGTLGAKHCRGIESDALGRTLVATRPVECGSRNAIGLHDGTTAEKFRLSPKRNYRLK